MDSSAIERVMVMLVPVVGTVGLFAFLVVAAWSRARQREREAFHRAELLRKLSDISSEAAAPVLAILRDDDARAIRRRREGLILAGMIWLVVGVAVIAAGHIVGTIDHDGTWALGLVPTFVGCALLAHAAFFAARPPKTVG